MGSEGTLAIGDVVAGKYRIVRSMAIGGMGEVYEAMHDELSMRIALKVLLREQARIPEAVERFLREARAAASLNSEHVAKVFDVGRTADGAPYLAMELLEGEDLEQLVERRGPLPVHEAVWYVLETLEALGEAHARGIVHRDLKPSNLFLSRSGDRSRVKVLDFGISKLERGMEAPQVSLTTTKSMLGSPGYMSPEQVRSSKNVDARTDIWSVGVILYELLQGSQAFVGETLGDVFAKIREEPLPSIRTVRPDVPEALDRILARCLERDRSQRFSSALELAQALQPYASPAGVDTARTLNVRDTPVSVRRALTVQTRTDWSTRYPQSRSGILPIVLGLLVSVIAGVALAVAIYKRTEGPSAALASATQPAEPGAAAGVVLPPAAPAPSVLTVPSSSPSGDPLAVVPAKSASAKPASQPPRSTGKDPGTKPPTATGKDPEGDKAGGSDKTGPKPNAYDPDDLGI